MTALADVTDVEARWRSLGSDEQARAEVLIDDASAIVRTRVPDVDTRITVGSLSADVAASVVANMVIRVMKNPEGVKQQTAGPFSVSYDPSVASGLLTLTGDELALLTGHASATLAPRSIRLVGSCRWPTC